MRVISGSAKGHPLNVPKGSAVRPTTGRVKEGIFSSIQQIIHSSIVVDLFAGSGGLGIECLSRNAEHTYFVEWSVDHVRCIQSNLEKTKLYDNATIIQRDVNSAILWLYKNKVKANLIFMDPPYEKELITSTLELLARYDILTNDGIIVAEHKKSEIPTKEMGEMILFKQKKYGDIIVSYYRKGE
ncbi:MAG: 16S rRNA (guanine(966)-N(2))-methyltransferase RsmD [Tindallia sp. MSAO_Bac2]|nr:MAG: 16S rRNA (guanine(966)-N(2))-methyltransferase RsmD [Tindallia sp. MSAO_Bac2]